MSVRIDGARSRPRPVNAGAPQGSVLGTYIFNIGTDNLEDSIETNTNESQVFELREGDLAFLELLPANTYAESSPEPIRFPTNNVDLSPTEVENDIRFEFLPTARNIPDTHNHRRIEPTWRPRPVTVKKIVDDNLQNEKISMRKLPTYVDRGITFKNARAGQSEHIFQHISTRAENRGLRVNSNKTALLTVSGSVS